MRDAVGAYRHVVVVGGTSEIARAAVANLIREGTRRITLVSRDPHRAADAFSNCGAHVESLQLDLSAPSGFTELAHECAKTSDIDLVIVAAGMLGDADRAAHEPAYATELMSTTFTGPAAITGAFADALAAQGHGTIVMLSSVAGYRVRGDNHVYGAAKAGLDGFAQGLSQRLHGTGVDVVIIRPGFVHTRMTAGMDPAPFAVSADRVADDLTDALRKGHHVVWSPSILKVVMGILRLLPAALFRRIAARDNTRR